MNKYQILSLFGVGYICGLLISCALIRAFEVPAPVPAPTPTPTPTPIVLPTSTPTPTPTLIPTPIPTPIIETKVRIKATTQPSSGTVLLVWDNGTQERVHFDNNTVTVQGEVIDGDNITIDKEVGQ